MAPILPAGILVVLPLAGNVAAPEGDPTPTVTIVAPDPPGGAARPPGRTPTFTRDQFVPVARLNADPTVFVVQSSAPWKSVKELVDDAKKRPNDILFSSAGNFSVGPMAIEGF